MQRLETPHHTIEQVANYIEVGERILQEAGYSDEERIALLPKVMELLAAKTITMAANSPVAMPAVTIPRSRH